MRGFLKTFFASLLALIIFTVLGVFIIIGIGVSAASSSKDVAIGDKAILVLDLSVPFAEQHVENPFGALSGDADDIPSLHEAVQLIEHAATDSKVSGIYIKMNMNTNGYAATEELRTALLKFRESKKFVIAYGETVFQTAYYLASAAERVYVQPKGLFEWGGLSVEYTFYKGLLDKLEIEPQIFYAGKFKSFTEPFRATAMTDANKLQTMVWLGDLYNQMLAKIADGRKLDTAQLRNLANIGAIQTPADAAKYKLIDAVKYDDDVKGEILKKIGAKPTDKINFVTLSKYGQAVTVDASSSDHKIAVIYANGDIIDGKGADGVVASDEFKNLLRKARMDKNVKAIVLRVNSPGGSVIASDVIWHEVVLAKKLKPVVVSMGDVAASGGYYISCAADSIFANKSTITGSIGVFTIIPNAQSFMKNKLGITFDGIKTGPYADMYTITRPLSTAEKGFLQRSVDTIYYNFKERVAAGRKLNINYVDSIAQGRVWTGERAVQIGLVDRIGDLNDAISCAARMAKLSDYKVRNYPEPKNVIEQILSGQAVKDVKANAVKQEIGAENYVAIQQLQQFKYVIGAPQARLPFVFKLN